MTTMCFIFLTLLLLSLAAAYGRPLAAAPSATKKAARTFAAAPAAMHRAAAAAPASSPWHPYSATSKQSAQYEAVQPQGDVLFFAPVDIKEAAAYALAEIVADATGSADEARNAAEVALGE